MKVIPEIRKKAEAKFPRYLSAKLAGEEGDLFPMDLWFPKLKKGRNALFAELEAWINAIRSGAKETGQHGYQIEWVQGKSRKNNLQTMPSRLYFTEEKDFLHFIGKEAEAKEFGHLSELVLRSVPELKSWILAKPLRFLKIGAKWPDLIKVIHYFSEVPQPNLYPRELPIEVPTKFVENNKGLIEELLKVALPEGTINWKASDFYQRLSLKKMPPWVQIRLLDPGLEQVLQLPFREVALNPVSLSVLAVPVGAQVFVIENRVTFLTFPPVKNAIAIWGKGFSVDAVQGDWLHGCDLWYWGDLDTHGFQILSRFRSHYPDARSLLMDEKTFVQYQAFVVAGKPFRGDSPQHLTRDEKELFLRLRNGELRLEQEHIAQPWVNSALKKIGE